ncbi:unnamed protein product [Urochloa humidicola]
MQDVANPAIKKGMKFSSLEELKFFLADYAVRVFRPFTVIHSDRNLRYDVICKQGCMWRVWSRRVRRSEQWKITRVGPEHTCRSAVVKQQHAQCTAKYLARRILGIVMTDNDTSIPSLIESIFAMSTYRVTYSKAWRAKQHAMSMLWGDWAESYGMVPRVLTAMARYNPGIKWFPYCNGAWLKQHFNHCPPGAPDQVVERHARVWLWHLCDGFLLPDGQGNQVTWSVLPILSQQWENIGGYSWGSATLSWLYRQLCEGCKRKGADSNLGGCAYLLQIWIWMRFAVGRPYRGELEVWPHNDEGSRPTVAFCWKNVPAVRGGPARRYRRYMDDLDCITESQIFWEPYTVDYAEELDGLGLSPMCTRDRQLWRSQVPLIFFHVVELHLPHRVMRQFGKLQAFPPEAISTSQALHSYDSRKRYGENDWRVTHATYLERWDQRQRAEPELGAMHRHNHYIAYLRWYLSSTRVFVKPPLPDPTVPIENRPDTDDEEDDITDAYDRLICEGTQVERAPIQNYMGQQLGRLANEAGVAMAHTSGGMRELTYVRLLRG